MIGHISRDGTAKEALEDPAQTQSAAVIPAPTVQSAWVQADQGAAQTSTPVAPASNAQGYKASWNGYWCQRSAAECSNARLKDEFGGNHPGDYSREGSEFQSLLEQLLNAGSAEYKQKRPR